MLFFFLRFLFCSGLYPTATLPVTVIVCFHSMIFSFHSSTFFPPNHYTVHTVCSRSSTTVIEALIAFCSWWLSVSIHVALLFTQRSWWFLVSIHVALSFITLHYKLCFRSCTTDSALLIAFFILEILQFSFPLFCSKSFCISRKFPDHAQKSLKAFKYFFLNYYQFFQVISSFVWLFCIKS